MATAKQEGSAVKEAAGQGERRETLGFRRLLRRFWPDKSGKAHSLNRQKRGIHVLDFNQLFRTIEKSS